MTSHYDFYSYQPTTEVWDNSESYRLEPSLPFPNYLMTIPSTPSPQRPEFLERRASWHPSFNLSEHHQGNSQHSEMTPMQLSMPRFNERYEEAQGFRSMDYFELVNSGPITPDNISPNGMHMRSSIDEGVLLPSMDHNTNGHRNHFEMNLQHIESQLENSLPPPPSAKRTKSTKSTTSPDPTVKKVAKSRGRQAPSLSALTESSSPLDKKRQFVCNIDNCLKHFVRTEHLKRHINTVHKGMKPFKCNVCEKSFSRSDNCNQHMRTHFKVKESKNLTQALNQGLSSNEMMASPPGYHSYNFQSQPQVQSQPHQMYHLIEHTSNSQNMSLQMPLSMPMDMNMDLDLNMDFNDSMGQAIFHHQNPHHHQSMGFQGDNMPLPL